MMRLLALLPLPWLLAAAPQDRPLARAIEEAVREAQLDAARVGIVVHSVRTGRTVWQLNANEPFILASNTKLLTTAAALDRLGPAFRFRTSAGMAGGNLHVFGGGDPNISGRFHGGDPTAVFKRWAADLREAGVRRVGDIVLHTGIFDEARLHPGWDIYSDFWFWWCAPFGPLSLNDNCVDLTIEPGPEGEPCRVTLSPDTSYVRIVNRTRSSRRPARPFGFTRSRGDNVITLNGEVVGRATYWVTIHDPTMYFGTVLKETLVRSGIAVEGAIRETTAPPEAPPGYRELVVWESELAPTLAVCNQNSQNFYAEMLLRVLGWKAKGRGTTENGLAAAREFLEAKAGLEQLSQADGSGLARENLAAPADLVRLLVHLRSHPHFRHFYDSLPASGQPPGTLRRRLAADDLRGRVRAKTGQVGGVSTLSGYAEAHGGDTFVFSILVNFPQRNANIAPALRLQDRLCALLVRQ